MDHIHIAVSMFNAAEVLWREFDNPSPSSQDEKERRTSLAIPMVISTAFGIEVGLKSLIKLQGKTPKKDHDLVRLFNKLPLDIQQDIDIRVKAAFPEIADVRFLLSEHRNHFEQWRYLGESQGPHIAHPGPMIATLRAIINIHSQHYGERIQPNQAGPGRPNKSGIPTDIKEKALKYKQNVYGVP